MVPVGKAITGSYMLVYAENQIDQFLKLDFISLEYGYSVHRRFRYKAQRGRVKEN